MRTIHYDKAKLFGWGGISVLLGGYCAYAGYDLDGEYGFMFLLASAAMLIAGPILIMKGVSDGVALASDSRYLIVSTLFRRKRVRWADIIGFDDEQLEQSHAFGLIKHKLADYVVIRVVGGIIGSQKLRIHCQLLEKRDANPRALVRLLEDAQADATNTAADILFSPQSFAAAPQPSVAGSAGDFDPDAIIARYMAKKGGGEAAPMPQQNATPARPTFGRKAV